MRLNFSLALTALIAGTAIMAQDDAPPETEASTIPTAPTTAPIVVFGEPDEEQKVLVGSRIPRKQTVKFTGIATNTGTRGLVPQSGMDQGASVRSVRTIECVSDNPAIGKDAACVLTGARDAITSGDIGKAQDLLAYLALTSDFSPQERLAGAQWQYRLADERGDDASREIALGQMIETGAMEPDQELSAQRTLVSMALADGRHEIARERLVTLDATGKIDSRRLANLAILTRRLKAGDANAIMRRAITMRETEGASTPQGWRDFVED